MKSRSLSLAKNESVEQHANVSNLKKEVVIVGFCVLLMTVVSHQVAEKSSQLDTVQSEMQAVLTREKELMERITYLEEEIGQLQNNCAALTAEKSDLSKQLKEKTEENASLSSSNQSLLSQEAALQEELAKLKSEAEDKVLGEDPHSASIPGDASFKMEELLKDATEQSEKLRMEMEQMRIDKDSILVCKR